ncbi:tetratricopeptide repeat protein [Maribellus mangrovi]|uniref:tetratricopeptide repeat protein n=1 Tax=Maribellus mangrovi TaxID=3133146 RepID=UPI0030ED9DEE
MGTVKDYIDKGIEHHNKGELVKATELYQKALETEPENFVALQNLGNVLVKQGKNKDAIPVFEKAYKINQNSSYLLNGWGNALMNLDENEKAIEKYEMCLKIDPNYKWAFYNWGDALRNLGKNEEAIKKYNKCLEIDPEYKEAYNSWGNALKDLRRFEEAIDKYEKCIEIDPEYKYLYYNYGNTLIELVRDKEAIEKFKRHIEIDPDDKNGYKGWGNALKNLGRNKEAIKKYKNCLDIDPENKAVFSNWGYALFNQGKFDEAIEKFNKSLEIDPGYYYAHNGIGISLMKLGKYADAIEEFEKSIEIDRNYLWAYIYWGNVLEEQGKPNEAIEKYNECIKISPDDQWGYYYLGKVHLKESPVKAIDYFTESLKRDKKLQDAYYSVYSNLGRIKDNEKIIDSFAELVKENDNPAGYVNLGHIYTFIQNDFKKGLWCYETSVEKGEYPGLCLDLSNYYDAAADLEKAIEVLNKSIMDDPEYIYAYHNKAHYLFKKGEYRESRELWQQVIEKYEKEFEGDSFYTYSSETYYYCGSVYFDVHGDFENTIKWFEKGLEFDKNNMQILSSMYLTYNEMDKRVINPDLSQFWKKNSFLKALEKCFQRIPHKEEELCVMAEVYIAEGEYDRAEELLNECLGMYQLKSKAYHLLGQLYSETGEYRKAVNALKKALQHEPHNLKIRVNLGNAYFSDKKYTNAEQVFNKVLQTDPNNVEARIGLADIFLNRVEERNETEYFEQAERNLNKALSLGLSDKGSKKLNLYSPKTAANGKNAGDRKYKDLKFSEIYYSMGYIKAKKMEQNLLDYNTNSLQESLICFKNSAECNPDNIKATTAITKITNNINSRKSANKREHAGTLLITGLAIVLFIFAQYFFFFNTGSERYELQPDHIAYVAAQFPNEISAELEPELKKIAGFSFSNKAEFLKALNNSIGENIVMQDPKILEQMDLTSMLKSDEKELLSVGYYVLISFGSILFMIAGLYLPQLLKIKVGVVEIEKSTLAEISAEPSFGISR